MVISATTNGTHGGGGIETNGIDHNASPKGSPFTIENIPYGIISTNEDAKPRAATAFEEFAVDLDVLQNQGLFKEISGLPLGTFAAVSLLPYHDLGCITKPLRIISTLSQRFHDRFKFRLDRG